MIVFSLAVILVLLGVLYPPIGKNAIEKSAYGFLMRDGYASADISLLEVRHSYINGLLGYGQWHTSIYFADEPKVEYYGILGQGIIPKVNDIRAGGFSTELEDDYQPLHYPA